MNNSDQPLSREDEQLTAYLDQRMTPEETAAFEREHPEATKERASFAKMQSIVKGASNSPALRNSEFFNRQILREISSSTRVTRSEPGRSPFSVWRLVFASACCALAAVGIYQTFVPDSQQRQTYLAEVLSVKTGDASLKARLIREDGVTVVMIDGLDPITEDFILN